MYDKYNWDQSILLESQNAIITAVVTTGTYSAGFLPLNGTLTAAGVYSNNIGNFLTIISAADESSNVFTIEGTDQAGRTWITSVAGVNAGTVTVQIPFVRINVDGISMLNNSSGSISIGISTQNATVWIPLDRRRQYFAIGMDVFLSASASLNYTVEYTKQPINGTNPPNRIFPDRTLVAQTTSATTTESWPWTAVRLRFNSWVSGDAVFEVQQVDDMHAGHKQN